MQVDCPMPAGDEQARLVRLRHEPGRDGYILAYSDEESPRVASAAEVGDIAASAVHNPPAPEGALAAPLVAQIAVTSDCNMACSFCYAELKAHRSSHNMSPDEIRQVIDMLHEHGVIDLEWAGGEPLLEPEFVDLLRHAHERDFKQAVLTNGTHLTPEFMEYAPLYVRRVQISIDDIGDHYNALKGGDFWPTLERNVLRAVAAGVPLIASIVLNEANASRLETIVEYIYNMGLPGARISWQVPMGEAKTTSLAAYLQFLRRTEKRVRRLVRTYRDRDFTVLGLQELPAADTAEFLPREYLLCSAARSRLYIDWTGKSYPCPVLKYPELCGGDVLEQGVQGVWHSPAFSVLRSVKNGTECDSCNVYCSYWCRALVYGFTRDMSLNPSPLCPRYPTGVGSTAAKRMDAAGEPACAHPCGTSHGASGKDPS